MADKRVSMEIDLSDLPAAGGRRSVGFTGEDGATFSLEIKNEDGHYYNFITSSFQVAKDGLKDKSIENGSFDSSVLFPAITDDDQYDISLFASVGTRHDDYSEVRFGDGSLDINSSKGSSSLLLSKVIYQYTAVTLTLTGISPNAVMNGISSSATVSAAGGNSVVSTPFTVTVDGSSDLITTCLGVLKQPTPLDILTLKTVNLGDAINIPGENIYPTATAAFTGDDVDSAITSGSVVRMDNTDLSAVIKVGDKITTPVTTSNVNGDFSGGATAITMGSAVATIMAVGDQVTTADPAHILNTKIFLVASLDSTNVFSLDSSVAIANTTELIFSSKVNRSLTTVTVVETSGTATDFTMSQAIQFRDNAPLTFFNQKNYRYEVVNYANIFKDGFIAYLGAAFTNVTLANYLDTTVVFSGTEQETTLTNEEVAAVETLGIKPVVANGRITTQAGAIVFSEQLLESAWAGEPVKIGGAGHEEILNITGWELAFTDLAISLRQVETTTTAAVNNSTSVPVASRNGILDDVSTVSGIGINPALVDPTVDTGAGAVTGSGTLVLTAAQTLENGVTLTFAGAGAIADITGNVRVLKAGPASATVRFNLDTLLSIT